MPGLTGFLASAPFPTSETPGTSEPRGTVGDLARDTAGNIYVLVDFQNACNAGEVVVFNAAYEASRPTSTSRGRVGIAVSSPSTSDKKGWVMVYGTYSSAWCTSEVTSTGMLFIPVTSDAGYVSEKTTTASNTVFGMWARSAADTATTPGAFSSTALALFTAELNFPYVNAVANDTVFTS
jgi:hypothetical protein